jgi:acetyl-CoA carboxylase biotin carboxyl carrier protein
MNFKEIQELIKLITKSDLTEFKMKDGEFEISIKTKNYGKQPSAPAPAQPLPHVPASSAQQQYAPPAPTSQPSPAPLAEAPEMGGEPEKGEGEDINNYLQIKSPIVGTFYRSPSPEKQPYIKVGDVIQVGTVVCIVEAMKLFNEIESEIAGRIVKVLVEDAQPVEYDQVLFLVDPKG